MTQPGEYTSVWERVGQLTDGELKALVDSAVAVLNRSAEPDEMITADMSASQVQSQMASALSEAGLPANQQDASAAVSSASDKAAVLAMLSAVAQVPGLREEIEKAYRRRQEMLFLDLGLVTGPALLILLLKLKRIKINSSGADVQFYDAQKSTVEMIRQMLGI